MEGRLQTSQRGELRLNIVIRHALPDVPMSEMPVQHRLQVEFSSQLEGRMLNP
jgi:hypothetical protein